MKTFNLDAEVPRIGQRAELVASWYLRFNGYCPLTSFILHDAGATKQPGGQITDADILALRLPHTREIIKGSGKHIEIRTDPRLDVRRGITDFIIAEVSSEECKFDQIYKNSNTKKLEFLEYCLTRFGYWPPKAVSRICKDLSLGKYTLSDERRRIRLRLFSFGVRPSDTLPGIEQITFGTVFEYMRALWGCYDPFSSEPTRKIVSDHKQWHQMTCQIYRRLRGHKVKESTPSEVVAWLFPDAGKVYK